MKSEAIWCEACSRRCYSANAGGRWQLSWRVGRGMPHVRYFEPELTECQVLAKQPPSALPGSFLRLTEVIGERGRVWMHFDAPALAANRLDLLRRFEASLSGPTSTEDLVRRWTKHWGRVRIAYDAAQDVDLFRTLGGLAKAMERARESVADMRFASEIVQPDDGAGLEVLDSSTTEPVASLSVPWTSAVSAACSEATMLAYAWRAIEQTVAAEFAAVAETLAAKWAPPATPRVRRSVQEIDVRQPAHLGLARRHA